MLSFAPQEDAALLKESTGLFQVSQRNLGNERKILFLLGKVSDPCSTALLQCA